MKEIIITPNAPAPVGPYNQAIKAGDTLYVSGQIAIDPATGNLVQGSIEEETHPAIHRRCLDGVGIPHGVGIVAMRPRQ